FSRRRRNTRSKRDWSSDVCSSDLYELLLAHGGDEKHIPVDWERLDCLGYSYVAFGHIHKPQAVRRNRILYAGAPEPTDRNDTGRSEERRVGKERNTRTRQ